MLAVLLLAPAVAQGLSFDQASTVDAVVVESASARASIEILAEVMASGGLPPPRIQFASDEPAFRSAIRSSQADVLVVVAHGEEVGITVGSSVLTWDELASDLRASGASEALVLACFSSRLESHRLALGLSYIGEVDLEIAALDAAFALGSRLSGAALQRFADAHNAYLDEHGGLVRFLSLMVQPQRLLSHQTNNGCTYQWNNWVDPGSTSLEPGASSECRTMNIADENHSCLRDRACDQNSEDEQKFETEVETGSSGEVRFGQSFDFLNDALSIGYGVNVDGQEYVWFFSFGADISGDSKRLKNAPNAGRCLELFDLGKLVMPLLDGVEGALESIPGVRRVSASGFSIQACAGIQGGIAAPGGRGNLEGNIEFRGVTGLTLVFKVWFAKQKTFKAEMVISYPVGVKMDLTDDSARKVINGEVYLGSGPLTFQLTLNALHIYFAADIPFTARKSDGWHFSLNYSWLTGGSAEAVPGRPAPPDEDRLVGRARSNLPLVLSPESNAAAVARPFGPHGTAVPLADVLELRPGDAFLNHLERTGALDRLGLRADGLGQGQSLYLDLADPRVYEALYGAPTERTATLLGIPGGVQVAGSSCEARGLGQVLRVTLSDCNPNNPVIGVGGLGSEGALLGDGTLPLDLRPSQHVATAYEVADSGEGSVRSPVCDEVGRRLVFCTEMSDEAAAPEGVRITDKALKAHQVKVILGRAGSFAWLTDPCSGLDRSVDTAVANPKMAGVCLHVVPMGSTIMSPQQVAAEFAAGVQELAATQGLDGHLPTDAAFLAYGEAWAGNSMVVESVLEACRQAVRPSNCRVPWDLTPSDV